jgi:hypothetical protein
MHDLPDRPTAWAIRCVELTIGEACDERADYFWRRRDVADELDAFAARKRAREPLKFSDRILELFEIGHGV